MTRSKGLWVYRVDHGRCDAHAQPKSTLVPTVTAAMVPLAALVASILLGLVSPAVAPFTCSTISIDCMCNWGSSGAWQQVGGLTKAPAEAQDSAEACERWCCTKADSWKDTPSPVPAARHVDMFATRPKASKTDASYNMFTHLCIRDAHARRCASR